MKNKVTLSFLLMLFPLFYSSTILAQCNDLIITAIFDGPLDGAPRGIELYARKNISDLSTFSIGSANNGGGSDGEEFKLPARGINAGDFIYVSKDDVKFHDFFGFILDTDLIPTTNAAVGFLNGDDAIELFCNGNVVDVFGEINHSGSGLNWNYEDGWVYRLSGTKSSTTFTATDWTIDRNALDEAMTNAIATTPIPLGTYDTFPACDRLLITGIFDGPLPGGEPQGIELFVTKDISDLSLFGFGSITNGGGSSGVEVDFPAISVEANTFLYITSDATSFHDFFGFAPTLETSSANINGDDAVELFCQQEVIDVFGEIDVDGTGTTWEYTDGWASRKDSTTANSDFILSNWNFGGVNALEGDSTNEQANIPFPIGDYQSINTSNCSDNIQLPLGDIVEGVYQAANTLTATATIPVNGNVTFYAGQTISLQAGFHAVSGSQFLASIQGCTNNFQEEAVRINRTWKTKNDQFLPSTTSKLIWQVYPNPTLGEITIRLELAEERLIQLELVDATGRLIKKLYSQKSIPRGSNKLQFNLGELDAGLYWIVAQGEAIRLTKKIILTK